MLAWTGYATLVGVLLAAAAACTEPLLRRLMRPARFLWFGALVTTMAFSLASAVTRGGRVVRTRAPRVSGGPLTSSPESAVSRVAASMNEQTPTSTAPSLESGLAGPPPTVDAPSSASIGLDAVVVMLWMISSAICLAVLVVSVWRVARMRRGWRERLVAGVPVLVSHDVGPAVVGLVHHGIVVPRWIETLDAEAQGLVMTHEREHVRAGDPLLLWSATLLVALMPWNLGLWIALRGLRHSIEMDCDARVLRSRPNTRAYCDLLLDVGERTLAGVAPIAALAEPATLLERRIDAMTTRRTPGRRVAVATLGAMLLVGAACWTPRPRVAPQERLSQLVTELSTMLRNDSARASLTAQQRLQLRDALDDGSYPRDSTGVRDTIPLADSTIRRVLSEARVKAMEIAGSRRDSVLTDSLVHAEYPFLISRKDTTSALLAIVMDEQHHIVRHAVRVGREYQGDVGELLIRIGIDTLSERTRGFDLRGIASWHVNAVIVAEGPGPSHGTPNVQGTFGDGRARRDSVFGDVRSKYARSSGGHRSATRSEVDSLRTLALEFEHGASVDRGNAITVIALQLDARGKVVHHANEGFLDPTRLTVDALMRDMLPHLAGEAMDARLILLRTENKRDPFGGPLYVLVVRPAP